MKGKRPYMVYLQLTKDSTKSSKYKGWICGGVIVHESYVLTSAACVEDADHFYVVSGTSKYYSSQNYKEDDCVCKNRRKVVWKCIPKNYKFDFEDSIKWAANDIAIVKVNRPFKVGVKEEGCEFPVCPVAYNNISRELEQPNTKAYIAGWGTTGGFREGVYKRTEDEPENSKCLQEAKVCVMDNEQCAKKWASRFRNIISQYMICTKDVMKRLSEICEKKYANCTDLEGRRLLEQSPEDADPETWGIDTGRHLKEPDNESARRSSATGGFCENDHGGPLIVKQKKKDVVIGVISACKIDPKSHSCHGPFLYTSVFYNRQFISCSINKDIEQSCRRVFRTGITHEEYHVDWSGVKDDENDRMSNNSDSDDDDDDDDERDDSDNSSIEVLRGSKTHQREKENMHKEDKKSIKKSKKDKRSNNSKGRKDGEHNDRKTNTHESNSNENNK